jgi:predicted glycosyltransferase involved in capsule biosynthesis
MHSEILSANVSQYSTCQEALSFVACFNGSENFENYLSLPQILKTLSRMFIKAECKVYPITYRKDTAGEYSSIPSLTSALVKMGGQGHAPVALPPGMNWYP